MTMTNKEWCELFGVCFHQSGEGEYARKASTGGTFICKNCNEFCMPTDYNLDFLDPSDKEHSIMEDWCLGRTRFNLDYEQTNKGNICCTIFNLSNGEYWEGNAPTKTLALRGAIEKYVKEAQDGRLT